MIHDLSQAQDPRELFDVVTADGKPTGRTKPRADVHRDGDWHRALHVWVVGIDERGPFITFQRRSLAKDTSPGKFDATVGGHFRAGEGLEESLREVEEEIGISVALSDLRFVGLRIAINEVDAGVIDRELQEIYFLRDDRPLNVFRPNPAELDALVRVQLDELLNFLSGERLPLDAISVSPGSTTVSRIKVEPEELVPRPDRYAYRVAIAARHFLNGEKHFSV